MNPPVDSTHFANNFKENDVFYTYMDTSEDLATQVSPLTITQEELFNAALMSSPNAHSNAIYTRLDTSRSSHVSPLATPLRQHDTIMKSHQKHKQGFELCSNMDNSLEDAESPGASPASLSEMYKREPFREYTNSPTGHMQETSPRTLLKNAMEVDKTSPQSMTTSVSPQSFKNKLTPQLFPTPSTYSGMSDSPPQPSTVSSRERRTRMSVGEPEKDDLKYALKMQEPYNAGIKEKSVEGDVLTLQPSTALSLMQYFDEEGLTGNGLEICEMLSNEDATLPQPDHFQEQNDHRWFDRSIIMDLLITTHQQLNQQEKTLHLATNIIDRFLLQYSISLPHLHILCAASLTLAIEGESTEALLEEILREIGIQDSECRMVTDMSGLITQNLGCSISSYISPIYWLARISRSESFSQKSTSFSLYFIDIPVIYHPLLSVKPSLVAATAVWLSRLILGTDQFEWSQDFVHFSGYDEDKIIPVADAMLTYCLKKDTITDCLTKKYSTQRYNQVAPLVKNWALRYWSEGDQVSLEEWLPFIVGFAGLWDT